MKQEISTLTLNLTPKALAEKSSKKKAATKAAEEAAEEAETGKKRPRVSFGGLDVENPDQIRMDKEAKEAGKDRKADRKAKAEAKKALKLKKKTAGQKHVKKTSGAKKKH